MAEVEFEERECAILLQLRGQEQVERLSNSQLTDADLNRHLPDAGDAQKYIVCVVTHEHILHYSRCLVVCRLKPSCCQ